MSDPDLDELAAELSEFAAPEAKGGRPPREERVIAGFEEIQRFAEKHGRAPQHGEDRDIFERRTPCALTAFARYRTAAPCWRRWIIRACLLMNRESPSPRPTTTWTNWLPNSGA